MVSQIKVNEIIKQSGSSITIGESGDTIDLSNPSSVTLNSTMKNTPYFDVAKTSDQNISDATWTKVTFDEERIDSNSAFDLSNDKFVVPSGMAGKYFFSVIVVNGSSTNNVLQDAYSGIAVNGTRIRDNLGMVANSSYPTNSQSVCTIILDLSVADYVEAYGYTDVTSGQAQFKGSPKGQTCFTGYKLLGV